MKNAVSRTRDTVGAMVEHELSRMLIPRLAERRYAVLTSNGIETKQAPGLLTRAEVENFLEARSFSSDTPVWTAAFAGRQVDIDGARMRFVLVLDDDEAGRGRA